MIENRQYTIVEGLIGIGKTTLVKMLGQSRDARLVFEQFEENPFLEKFYEDPDRYAFQTELSFLASRYKQQQSIQSRELFSTITIADYMFQKNRIFAGLTLKGDELALYDNIYRIMHEQAPQPDLIVYLTAGMEQVMNNIRKRGRSYEQNISVDYLSALNQAYKSYLSTYKSCPVAFINCQGVDFVKEETSFQQLQYIILEKDFTGVQSFELHP
jgi:deoxyadenosine/deoxycytidine kinase